MDYVWRWQKHHCVWELGGSTKFSIGLSKYAHTVNLWVCELISQWNEGRAWLKGILIVVLKKLILSEMLWSIRPLLLKLVL